MKRSPRVKFIPLYHSESKLCQRSLELLDRIGCSFTVLTAMSRGMCTHAETTWFANFGSILSL
jgi:hypothetical protein